MKVTIDWLKKYVDFDLSPEELGHELTMLGLELEGIEHLSYNFSGVVIGKVLTAVKHDNKPNLSICQVDVGSKKLQLLCGAPNVRKDQYVAVALPGAELPGGKKIQSIELYGVSSEGMICSEAELGISHQADIIMELNDNAKIGADLKEYLGQPEIVLDLSITPNRPDCLGVIGIAREVAALLKKRISKPIISINESDKLKIEEFIKVEILNPESCPRYTARYIEGVKVGPSPRWLIQKLEAVGVRTINNIVDITNYVMMETGQPLHAFDYDLLSGGKIIVKHAREGEKFVTLDEKEHILSSERLLICDSEKPVALAGVMGGLNSEISDGTTRVLLESAYFNPTNIRRTAKSLEISSESSRRFERGVDPEGVVYALNRAAQLIQEIAGGEVAKGFADVYPGKKDVTTINLRTSRVNEILGSSFEQSEITELLERLEFQTEKLDSEVTKVTVPTFRVDIEREIDLIEEIARLYGYNNFEENSYSRISLKIPVNKEEKFQQILRDFVVRLGYNEVLTHPLTSYDLAKKFHVQEPVSLKNPLSKEMGVLRTSLIASLLEVARWNRNRKVENQQLFEIGNIFYYTDKEASKHAEEKKLALLRIGNFQKDFWLEKSRKVNFYDLKGDLAALFQYIGIQINISKNNSVSYLDSEKSAEILLKDKRIGCFGLVAKEILAKYDIDEDVFVTEIDFHELLNAFNWEKRAKKISKFPAVKRDIAVVVDQLKPAELIESHIWESGGEYLRSVELFDVYRGKQIAADKKSFAFALTFQADDRTLTESEVDANFQKIIEYLKKKDEASLR